MLHIFLNCQSTDHHCSITYNHKQCTLNILSVSLVKLFAMDSYLVIYIGWLGFYSIFSSYVMASYLYRAQMNAYSLYCFQSPRHASISACWHLYINDKSPL